MAANLPPAARSSSRPPRPRSSASEFSHPEAGRPATATRRSNRDIDRHSTRDRDLVAADALLTDTALDDLWEWFTREVHDPQLMFVKMVNAVCTLSKLDHGETKHKTFAVGLHACVCVCIGTKAVC